MTSVEFECVCDWALRPEAAWPCKLSAAVCRCCAPAHRAVAGLSTAVALVAHRTPPQGHRVLLQTLLR